MFAGKAVVAGWVLFGWVLQLLAQSCLFTICQNRPKHRSAFRCSHSSPRNALPFGVWRFLGRSMHSLSLLLFCFAEEPLEFWVFL